jgi:hypothetical protein
MEVAKDEPESLMDGDDLVRSAFGKAVEALGLTADQAAQFHDQAQVLLIYHLAGTAFPGGGGAVGWMMRPNTAPVFGGRRPLDLMVAGQVQPVIDYLQAAVWLW